MVIGQQTFQKKLTRDEGSTLEKSFWQMAFRSVDVLPVYGFLKTYILMVTNMKDNVTPDPDYYDADFKYGYRDAMIPQFKQGLDNKNFILHNQAEGGQTDTLQNRIKFWLYVIDDTVGPIPDNIYNYN